jgi:hypothetical protein
MVTVRFRLPAAVRQIGPRVRAPAWTVICLVLVGCSADRARATVDAERVRGGCRVVGGDSSTGERTLRACTAAADQLSRILGVSAPSGVILLARDSAATDDDVARRAGEMWGMAIPQGGVAAERLDLGAGREMSVDGYLTHEAAHRIAYAMLFPPGDATPAEAGPSYGSPLPDWLDEALGQLTEPEADQRARMAPLSDGPIIYALPLRRLLYMPHPALQGVPPGAPLRRVFYGQSLAFALFLTERGGPEGFRSFVREVRSGKTQGVALTSIPGLPTEGGDLEAAWLAWLRDRQFPGRSAMSAASSASMAGAVLHRHAPSHRWILENAPTPLRRNA